MIRKVLSFVAKYSLRVNLAFRTIDQNFCVEYEPGMFHFLVHHHEQCLQSNCIWCVCWFCDFPVLKFRQSRHFWKKKNLVSLKFIRNKKILLDWKIDDCWILLKKKCIFSKTFYTQNNKFW